MGRRKKEANNTIKRLSAVTDFQIDYIRNKNLKDLYYYERDGEYFLIDNRTGKFYVTKYPTRESLENAKI